MNENYLNRHIEPVSGKENLSCKEMEAELPDSVTRYFPEKILEESAEGKKAEVELEKGFRLSYEQKVISEADIERLLDAIGSADGSENICRDLTSGRLRQLTQLVMIDPEGVSRDILNDFPKSDICIAQDDKDSTESVASSSERLVFSYVPLNSFYGLAHVTHELGHIKSAANKDSEWAHHEDQIEAHEDFEKGYYLHPLVFFHSGLSKRRKEIVSEAGGVILREERRAWAAALSSIRNYIEAYGVSTEDCLKVIHDLALTSHSDVIRQHIRGMGIVDAAKIAMEFLGKIPKKIFPSKD